MKFKLTLKVKIGKKLKKWVRKLKEVDPKRLGQLFTYMVIGVLIRTSLEMYPIL